MPLAREAQAKNRLPPLVHGRTAGGDSNLREDGGSSRYADRRVMADSSRTWVRTLIHCTPLSRVM
jgi:hypothetical protein